MERLRPLLLILVPGMLLLAHAIHDEEVLSTRGIEGDAATELDDDVGDSAAFMVVVEREDGARYSGSLVSARTALTSAECSRSASAARPLWVRPPGGSARRVSRVAVSVGSTVGVALLELETALGPPARPILVPTVPSECAAPAACYVVCIASRRLRIADEQLVPAEACGALIPRSLDDVLCLRGEQSCAGKPMQRRCGGGVVCAGKLCGVVGETASAGCGTPYVAAALPRHRRFLQCAHRQGACTRGGECEHLCTETLLLDDEYISAAEVSSANFKSSPRSSPALADGPVKAVNPGTGLPRRTSSGFGVVSWVSVSVKSPAPSLRLSSVPLATRSESHVTRSLGAATSPDAKEESSMRPAFEFEPNRPDFKAGEYGDNAVEYGGEEVGQPARTAPAAPVTPASPVTPAPPVTPASPGRVPADIAARVSPAEASSASRGSECADLLPEALLLLLPITDFIQYIFEY